MSLSESYVRRREAVIEFWDAVRSYYKHNENDNDLERIVLLSYQLSTMIRADIPGPPKFKLEVLNEPLQRIINRAMTIVDKPGVDLLVQSSILEMISRNGYRQLMRRKNEEYVS